MPVSFVYTQSSVWGNRGEKCFMVEHSGDVRASLAPLVDELYFDGIDFEHFELFTTPLSGFRNSAFSGHSNNIPRLSSVLPAPTDIVDTVGEPVWLIFRPALAPFNSKQVGAVVVSALDETLARAKAERLVRSDNTGVFNGYRIVRISDSAGVDFRSMAIRGDALGYTGQSRVRVKVETINSGSNELGVYVVSNRFNLPYSDTQTVVFGLWGQSNMRGAAGNDGGETYPSGTQQFTTGGGLELASGPLDHIEGSGSGEPSIGLSFAIEYVNANPSHTVILVPCAVGGTGFSGNDWNPGDARYNAAVAAVNAAMALDPAYVLGGILWHQGENDGLNGGAAAYQSNLTAMVSALRADITAADPTTPFVCGNLREDFNTSDVPLIRAILADAPNFLDYCGFAPSTGLTGGDDRHFNAGGLRALGAAYYPALVAAKSDLPSAPGQVSGLTAVAGDGAVSLSWTAEPSATSYTIFRSVSSGTGLTAIGTTSGVTSVDSTVTNGTDYFYTVAATNAVGSGPQSAEATATPVSGPSFVSVIGSDFAESFVSGSAATFAAVSTTSSDLVVATITIGNSAAANVAATGLTIGGTPGTKIGGQTRDDCSVEFWQVNGVSGSTNDVAVQYAASVPRQIVVCWSMSGAVAVTDTDGVLYNGLTAQNIIDVAGDGVVLAVSGRRGSNDPSVITFAEGGAPVVAALRNPTPNVVFSAAHSQYAAPVTGSAVNWGTSDTGDGSAITVSISAA